MLKPATTFAPVLLSIFAVLSAADPSIKSTNLAGDPPIAVSSGTVASIKIFSPTNSLIDCKVAFCAAKGTVSINKSPAFAASSFDIPTILISSYSLSNSRVSSTFVKAFSSFLLPIIISSPAIANLLPKFNPWEPVPPIIATFIFLPHLKKYTIFNQIFIMINHY